MLRLTGNAVLGVLIAGCGSGGSGGGTDATSAGQTGETTMGPRAVGTRGVVFNTASQDVTLFNPASNEVTGSRPTNAVVRWLSNEQNYWDGESIWTYDFPENELRAIAIDPKTFEVTKQVPVNGAGPGHSFVLTPDNRRGFVNSAGSDFLAVVDPAAGEVVERIEMGAFP
jgi:DNA-binding beta-propeller fold protein YncE